MLCLQHHRSACRVVLESSSLMCQRPTSRRNLPGRSSALEKCSLCLIIAMTRLAHWILWVSTSRAWTSSTCLECDGASAQITKDVVGHVEKVVSWFDRKSQVAADEPLYRFQT